MMETLKIKEENCDDEFLSEFEHEKRIKSMCSEQKLYSCDICDESFSDSYNKELHLLSHIDVKPYSCDICCTPFTDKASFDEHRNSHATGKSPKTDWEVCNEDFPDCVKLEQSQDIHDSFNENEMIEKDGDLQNGKTDFVQKEDSPQPSGQNDSHVCIICDEVFKDPTVLAIHMNGHLEAEKIHKCDQCNKAFAKKNALRVHYMIHTGEKKFICDTCGKGFSDIQKLKSHMNIHSGHKPYKCEFCWKSVAHPSNLRKHMLTHTGEKPFRCTICYKGYTSKHNLSLHMMSHDKEKSSKSGDADGTYLALNDETCSASKRKTHSSNKRVFPCDTCGKIFTQRSSLQTHTRLHTGERPFTCTVCGKKCISHGNLKAHLLTHTGEKPYKCSMCQKSYTSKHNLNLHMRNHMTDREDEGSNTT